MGNITRHHHLITFSGKLVNPGWFAPCFFHTHILEQKSKIIKNVVFFVKTRGSFVFIQQKKVSQRKITQKIERKIELLFSVVSKSNVGNNVNG